MATIAGVKQKLQRVITKSNATTGQNDTTVTGAVKRLINGYGRIVDVSVLPYKDLVEGTVYRLTLRSADVYLRNSEFDSPIHISAYLAYKYPNVCGTRILFVDAVPEYSDSPILGDTEAGDEVVQIVESTGVAYVCKKGMIQTVGRLARISALNPELTDLGWVSDKSSIPANSVGCIRRNEVELYIVENGSLVKISKSEPKVVYTLSDDGSHYIVTGNVHSTENNITIHNGHGNTQLAPYAFTGDIHVTHASVYDLPSVADSAFFGARGLQYLNTEWVDTIGKRAFMNCTNLSSFHCDAGEIDDEAFKGCRSLGDVALYGGRIGDSAFEDCAGLTNVYIGRYSSVSDSITIGDRAFANCRALGHFDMGYVPVEHIGNSAFSGCYSLWYINLQDGLKEIGSTAFNECYSLFDIVIPSNVTSIGFQAFFRSGLRSVVFKGKPSLLEEAFGDCPYLTDIFVPWSKGEVAGAPWGATNATIHYNYTGE